MHKDNERKKIINKMAIEKFVNINDIAYINVRKIFKLIKNKQFTM